MSDVTTRLTKLTTTTTTTIIIKTVHPNVQMLPLLSFRTPNLLEMFGVRGRFLMLSSTISLFLQNLFASAFVRKSFAGRYGVVLYFLKFLMCIVVIIPPSR